MARERLVKVCGMREAENIASVEALGIDLMGFIFYAKSPRFVRERPSYLPTQCRRVGVFVNESVERVKELIEEYELDFVQLHGGESVEFCRELRESGVAIIKAISISEADDLAKATPYVGECDMLLFDTKCDGHGGSGVQFDWSILAGYRGETPFLLSGGIEIGSVETLREFSHPQLVGYDVNSRFELEPALKDVALVEAFLEGVKK
ncbi:MAG: phosphoribosylanthranilate isomerase [Rikenellaceae bacterium]